jgi:alkylhydroperoxidase family enzyme
MAWIPYLQGDDIDDSLQALCAEWKCDWEAVDNVIRIHGANPGTLRGHMALYQAVLHQPSPLSRLQREIIGVVVSAENGCDY